MTVSLEAIAKRSVNLASPRLGTQVIFATDDFFAAKERMIQDSDPVFIADKYDDHGKWMDGWESRRRRDGGRDHAIIKLGTAGVIHAASIDTNHFTGNFAPAASIEGCFSETEPGDQTEWRELLAPYTLGPDAEHLVAVDCDQPVNWIRLTMFPDGGIARLRLYGETRPDWSAVGASETVELSALKNGGRIVGYNNAHYGSTWTLLTEGRGINMGDGWETRRRREPGHDWIVLALGHAGTIDEIEIDTAHFKGNFPDSASVHAAFVDKSTDEALITQSMFWQPLLPQVKLQADHIHRFDSSTIEKLGPVTHVRLNIFPDGGVSRFRTFGKRHID
ncbi:MAG: allantoicase [Kordiimonadaceae bacterium]|nr:allantoicase [Kordiimonadaceae bacterium]MBO6567475.1 allantoicase [Kordiimonadaceae bacterium]MBO6963311.1 allantoicase [Kordiimonadaceae bacterium]